LANAAEGKRLLVQIPRILSERCSNKASSSSIFPTVLPIFTYDYKAKNERQEARGKNLFINAESIQASVLPV
jgi:hypothetical protein